MDEAKQMTVEEALDAADQIVGFYDGDPYDLIERGCDTLEVLAAEVRRLTAALATARREGAEEMRERCAARCEELADQESALAHAAEERGDQHSAAIHRHRGIARLQAAAEIRALPLDAPGGATCARPSSPRACSCATRAARCTRRPRRRTASSRCGSRACALRSRRWSRAPCGRRRAASRRAAR